MRIKNITPDLYVRVLVPATLRDLMVLAGVLTIERQSLPALVEVAATCRGCCGLDERSRASPTQPLPLRRWIGRRSMALGESVRAGRGGIRGIRGGLHLCSEKADKAAHRARILGQLGRGTIETQRDAKHGHIRAGGIATGRWRRESKWKPQEPQDHAGREKRAVGYAGG